MSDKENKTKIIERKNINHTLISLPYSICAIIIFILLYAKTQNLIILIQLCLGIIGFIGLQLLNSEKTIITRKFKPISIEETIIPTLILSFIVVPIISFLYNFSFTINYTTEDYYFLLLFCPAIEELFFRGFLITFFVKIKNKIVFFKNELDNITHHSLEYLKSAFKSINFEDINNNEIDTNDSLTNIYSRLFGIAVVSIQALSFCLYHTNYYNKPFALISVLIMGYIFGLYYIESKDITPLMVIHFLINFLVFLHEILI